MKAALSIDHSYYNTHKVNQMNNSYHLYDLFIIIYEMILHRYYVVV